MENRVWSLERAEEIFDNGVIGCEIPEAWYLVATKMDGSDIFRLAATSQFFWNTLSVSHVWKSLVLRKLRIADPPITNMPYPWFILYVKNFTGTHMYTDSGNGHLSYLGRIGGFILKEADAIIAWNTTNFKQGSRLEKLEALLRAKKFKAVKMKPGIWIADLHEFRCSCGVQGCPRRMKSFDVRHIDFFATTAFNEARIFYRARKQADVDKVDVQVPQVVTAAVIGSCRKDANLKVFEDWEGGVQFMVTSNGVTVKICGEQEQQQAEQLHGDEDKILVDFEQVLPFDATDNDDIIEALLVSRRT